MAAHKSSDNIIRQVVSDTKDQPIPIKDSIIEKMSVQEEDILELNEGVFELNESIPLLKEYGKDEEV